MANPPKIIPLTPAAADALEARGILPEVAAGHGVASLDRRDGDWVAFRHHVDGGAADHWAYRSLTGDKQFWQSAGTKRVFWNNQVIDDPDLLHLPVIITEGHLDALAVMVAGYTRVVSVPDGAPGAKADNAKSKYDFLGDKPLAGVREVILAVDGDEPGLRLLHDLAVRLGKGRCKWVRWPKGCKDANDVLQELGPEALVGCINGARWFRLDGLYTLDQLPDEPPENPVKIGIAGLDDLWRISTGRMSILTGIPSHGKTELIADVAMNLAENHGWVTAIGSFEDKPKQMLVPRLRRWLLRTDPRFASDARIAEADAFIRDHFVFIQNDDNEDDPANVAWCIERAEAAVLRHNAKLVVLDPWNEIDHTSRPVDVSVTEYTNVMLGRLRRHAKALNYHVLIAPHPTKLSKDKDGQYPVPTGYNVSDSAAWVNKPDTGLSIYRHKDDTVTIGCWKCKSAGAIGQRGDRMFKFHPQIGRYDYAPELEEKEAA